MLPRVLCGRAGRRQLAGAAVCLLALLVSGCAPAQPTPEPATVRFGYPRELCPDATYVEALAAEFHEAHPQITIELHPMRWQQLGAIATGEGSAGVDAVIVQPSVQGMYTRGDILDLTPWINEDGSFDLGGFYPGTVEPFRSEGRMLAIPIEVDPLVLYYNRDLFDEHEIPYPEVGWTWEDFLSAAYAIRDPETGVLGYAIFNIYADLPPFIYQHGGRILDDWQDPTRVTLDDPRTIEALQWYADLIHEYNVGPTAEQAQSAFELEDYRTVYEAILAGRVGMWMGNFSDRGGRLIGAQYPGADWRRIRWGMAPLPRDARAATQVRVEGLAISSQAADPEACWQWVSFLSRQIPYTVPPAYRPAAESEAYAEYAGADAAAVLRAAMESDLLFAVGDRSGSVTAGLEAFWEGAEEVVAGNMRAEEAMAKAQQEAGR